VPTLALFGADDPVVPVAASVAAFESYVAPELLTVAVLPGGDHRIQRDGQLVDDYFDTLSAFVEMSLPS
jgi:pimeloyl-ACP methyl ester carboxylesterase